MAFLEGGESFLEPVDYEVSIEDVDMVDVEEGECVEHDENTEPIEAGGEDDKMAIQDPPDRNSRGKGKRKKKKKKNKKRGISTSSITDINRFVIDTCRRLKEKKSYLVWNAVGCLGIGAFSDLVKEVDAIQACGGQMTADGKRFRTGGGILWSILKTRGPKAYKEIMMKGKEFEKQFRQQRVKQVSEQNKEDPSQKIACDPSDSITNRVSKESLQHSLQTQSEETNETDSQGKRISVLNRIRVPVSYDDLVGEEPKDQ
ncbi:uncharacterized protein LOC122068068 [Macadamia integrifolia]|uniref:uncharacterized protein LOC122068068 n=1 Tax=Macadamia integrifolia TaxID=60698 RepID=UPI001C4F1589|nr:uncharacterized protein LOC122068068 [Macadamia integrifolia]XP_042487843.1 uncharacterized protein LOC122068068 [Macadamia integrifolia]XP_042487844.1 uncharacterized protein LOC122068068 [Macadamia integrifolia]XP_042487845.1 uncharacterized protein LOC122068068 [Macadamia integrifolia]XP_042487846.1 uncharacterized protein LOC122068068 [Macadamia integrifolia]XP_042487847.1 uncharacterized protein LOC122068068 [Macadamia integrifolia]